MGKALKLILVVISKCVKKVSFFHFCNISNHYNLNNFDNVQNQYWFLLGLSCYRKSTGKLVNLFHRFTGKIRLVNFGEYLTYY